MYRNVLVPLDGSTVSELALNYAGAIARRSGAMLHLVLVHQPIARYAVEIAPVRLIDRWEDRQREREARYVEARAAALRAQGLAAVAEVREGDVARELIQRAAADVDLMVLTARWRGGADGVHTRTDGDEIMRHVQVPVLLVPPAPLATPVPGEDPAPVHILAATDGSDHALAGVHQAARLARLFGARLTLLRVIAPAAPAALPRTAARDRVVSDHLEREARRDLDDLVADVGGGLAVEVVVERGHRVAQAILVARARLRADLLAIGAHRRTRIGRLVLGSVAAGVARATSVPLLVAHGEVSPAAA
jgi:nucleotide-binding universal stress UspA family protein